MKLNTKMRYGTRAMLELALRYEAGAVSLAQVAASQEISDKYLEILFASLRSAGLVNSQRGARGGYSLARPPEQITLREIFDVLEGPEPYVPCTTDHDTCHRWATCVDARGLGTDVRCLDASAGINYVGGPGRAPARSVALRV